jgi:hypothetical protein
LADHNVLQENLENFSKDPDSSENLSHLIVMI